MIVKIWVGAAPYMNLRSDNALQPRLKLEANANVPSDKKHESCFNIFYFACRKPKLLGEFTRYVCKTDLNESILKYFSANYIHKPKYRTTSNAPWGLNLNM